MERLAIVTSEERKPLFEGLGIGREAVWETKEGLPVGEALARAAEAGTDVAIVDDAARGGSDALEQELLDWAAGGADLRVVFVADESRDTDDPYLFQLVSKAGIKDLVVPSAGHTLEATLPKRVAEPSRAEEYSWWATGDRRLLKRKGGLQALSGMRRAKAAPSAAPGADAEAAARGPGAGEDIAPGSDGRGRIGGSPAVPDPAALMGPPDAGHPAEEGVRAPSAKTIVAVGALRPGIGCTHLAVALGIELASCNRSAAVALRDRAQLNRMGAVLDGTKPIEGGGFSYRGCDFYYWSDQRRFAANYDYAVADCGVVDLDDEDLSGPSALFKRARLQAFVVSGAPWDLAAISDVLAKYRKDDLARFRWCTFGAASQTTEAIRRSLAGFFGEGFDAVFPIPYRANLFTSPKSQLEHYSRLLKPVLPDSVIRSLKQTGRNREP